MKCWALLGLVLCMCCTWTLISAEDTEETRLSNFRADSSLLGSGFGFADQHRKRLTGIILNSLAKKVQFTSDKLNLLSKLIMDKKEKLFKPKMGQPSNYLPPASIPAYSPPHSVPVQPNYGQGFGLGDPGSTYDPNYGFEPSASITPPPSIVPFQPKREEPSTSLPTIMPSTDETIPTATNVNVPVVNTETNEERASGPAFRPPEDEWIPVPMVIAGSPAASPSSSPVRTRRHANIDTLDFTSSADESEVTSLKRNRRQASQIPSKMNAEAQSLRLAFSDLINDLENNISENQRHFQNDDTRERDDGFISVYNEPKRPVSAPSNTQLKVSELKRTIEHLEKARQRFIEIEKHVKERIKNAPVDDLKNTVQYFDRLLDVEWNRVNAIRKQFEGKLPAKPDNREPVNDVQNDAIRPEKLYNPKAKVVIVSKYISPKTDQIERME